MREDSVDPFYRLIKKKQQQESAPDPDKTEVTLSLAPEDWARLQVVSQELGLPPATLALHALTAFLRAYKRPDES